MKTIEKAELMAIRGHELVEELRERERQRRAAITFLSTIKSKDPRSAGFIARLALQHLGIKPTTED